MIDLTNKIYVGSENRQSLYDLTIPKEAKALIVFAHGYKGYKDWGAWNVVEQEFVKAGFGFLKFNMSHNGGTVKEPIDFPDLDAFGMNDYTKELFDLKKITTIATNHLKENKLSIPIYLIGHSRGGGVAIIHAQKDKRIEKLITWAAISDIESRFPTGDELDDWEFGGVRFVKNGRTNQMMPHFYSFYENYLANKENLDIQFACEHMNKPFLPIHGDMDLAVSISEGIQISRWAEVDLRIIKGAEHTFQTKHPWESKELPYDMNKVVQESIIFFEKAN